MTRANGRDATPAAGVVVVRGRLRAGLTALLAVLVGAAAWTAGDAGMDELSAAAKPGNKPEAKPKKPGRPPNAKDPSFAVQNLKNTAGLQIDLWAAEPLLLNPVSLWVDTQGKVYVAETHRWKSSTYDIRSYTKWWEDDTSCRTVADRDAMHRKWMGPKADTLTESEIVRLVWDSTGSGKADKSTVFSAGLDTLADGLASGVLEHEGNVYVAAIPNLWRMKDSNGDGVADIRDKLHHGYGVRLAFLGHDLHGLIMGPDGKLYFSIGDRGLHLDAKDTPDGRSVSSPDTGAVLRCNLDGTGIELFHTGLRNPQELAFDEWGNLFTCDNNCDNGDKARWVYVAEGADTGWRIGYQRLGKSGPWMQEGIWELPQSKAWYRVPPLAHVSHGPSGLAYHPGTAALPDKYKNRFFLCNVPGNILAVGHKPKGAGWEVTATDEIVGNWWPSDVAFGPDGKLYATDWVGAWDKNNLGRIFQIYDKEAAGKPELAEVRKLIAGGTAGKSVAELVGRLSHADMRVRQAAQFALAGKGAEAVAPLKALAADAKAPALGRLHALWALGQIAAKMPSAAEVVPSLLSDAVEPLRAQAARVAGDLRLGKARDGLVKLLTDGSARVRFEAAVAVGKLGDKSVVPAVLALAKANADADALLRHAAVMGLAGSADLEQLSAAGRDADKSVRLAALLAMRKRLRPEISQFLTDAEPELVLEAARAINDMPIPGAGLALAALAGAAQIDPRVAGRIINANLRRGDATGASALAKLAGRTDLPENVRIEAVKALGEWPNEMRLDRVTGNFRPRPAGDRKLAADATRLALIAVQASGTPAKLKAEAARVAQTLGLKEAAADLLALVRNPEVDAGIRADALAALASGNDATAAEAVKAGLADTAEPVRAVAARHLAKAGLPRADASAKLAALLADPSVRVRQSAVVVLGETAGDDGAGPLVALLGQIRTGKLAAALQLDVLEAAAKRSEPAVKDALAAVEAARDAADPLAAYLPTLEGGDAAAGRRTFFENATIGCFKCHAVKGDGGVVGPGLEKIGKDRDRRYILESIVLPNKVIAKGYEQVIILTEDETTETGRIEKETDAEITIIRADATRKTIQKKDIAARRTGQSAMPADIVKQLGRREMRDLVEYLAGLKDEGGVGHGAGK